MVLPALLVRWKHAGHLLERLHHRDPGLREVPVQLLIPEEAPHTVELLLLDYEGTDACLPSHLDYVAVVTRHDDRGPAVEAILLDWRWCGANGVLPCALVLKVPLDYQLTELGSD
jgi:hypothetical protein